jgi:hypothetical protein
LEDVVHADQGIDLTRHLAFLQRVKVALEWGGLADFLLNRGDELVVLERVVFEVA